MVAREDVEEVEHAHLCGNMLVFLEGIEDQGPQLLLAHRRQQASLEELLESNLFPVRHIGMSDISCSEMKPLTRQNKMFCLQSYNYTLSWTI